MGGDRVGHANAIAAVGPGGEQIEYVMHSSGQGVFFDSADGEGSGAAGLMMMSYRRQRMLSDIRDPVKRGSFASKEAFARSYGRRHTPRHRDGKKASAAEPLPRTRAATPRGRWLAGRLRSLALLRFTKRTKRLDSGRVEPRG